MQLPELNDTEKQTCDRIYNAVFDVIAPDLVALNYDSELVLLALTSVIAKIARDFDADQAQTIVDVIHMLAHKVEY